MTKRKRLRKEELHDTRFEREACIIIGEVGCLYLTHLEADTADGRRLLFNGLIKLPISQMRWVEGESNP